ncbi:hypothetical protein F3Y22_tig00111877pilonHSYRG00037 [Hibiscus syriacus]|uniref:Uncharacterized protein n=1 Tax=Hibiscus syriacus TaxID=106335 RepID=A0A6A2X9G2_HIBSY|nr:hypothetical protein F3Y22_tig00111877pilonHSYRG00037 [Hibiscus syriacus]
MNIFLYGNSPEKSIMQTSADEEDRIIISAHAIHGNKWASIAKLLPGRTDNAIKNHWNSMLRHRCMELGRFKPGPADTMEDDSLDRTKASSEETLSVGDKYPFKPLEGRDVVMDGRPNSQEDKPSTPEDQNCRRVRGPSYPLSSSCTWESGKSWKMFAVNPSFPCDVDSVAAQLLVGFILKSGLENNCVRIPSCATTSQRMSQGDTPHTKSDLMGFDDGQSKLTGISTEFFPSQMPKKTCTMRSEVEGLS